MRTIRIAAAGMLIMASSASLNAPWEVAEADGSRLVHSLSSAPSLCSVHEVFSEAE